jgi:hypothetical protein
MNARIGLVAAAALLAGCSTTQTVVESDPVIAGKTYASRPVALGPVKMAVDLQAQVVDDDDPAAAEQLDVTLGFLAAGEPVSVVARSGTLTSQKDGAQAALVGRFQSRGSPIECVAELGAELGPEYWFNGMVRGQQFSCVTLRFRLPGHRPGDPVELAFEPVNVGGRMMRLLPVTFVFRTETIEVD